MKNLTRLIAVFSIFSTVFFGSSAFTQDLGGMNQRASMFKASHLIGLSVWSSDGRRLGQISNLVVDKMNERVVLAVLSDLPGLGGKVVAVPFGFLTKTGERLVMRNYGLNEVWIRILNMDAYLSELKRDSSLVGLPSVIDPEWVYRIYMRYDQPRYWKEFWREEPLSARELYPLDRLMGSKVRSAEGGREAQISDLVINSSDGQVAFLILSDVSERAGRKTAVPFSTLAMKDDNTFVINVKENMLAGMPLFNGDVDAVDMRWGTDAYKYFGLQPRWAEDVAR